MNVDCFEKTAPGLVSVPPVTSWMSVPSPPVGRRLLGRLEIEDGQADLLQVVRALCTPSRFASDLDGRQQQLGQNADDGDDHQQFDQRKACVVGRPTLATCKLSWFTPPKK